MYVWTEARAGQGFFNLGFWNAVSTIGAFALAAGVLLFLVNVVRTHRQAPPAPLDPWDARTLEWMTPNPPPPHNFDTLPDVHALDEFFHRKYEDIGTGDHHDMRRVATAEQVLADLRQPDGHPIHLPSPSYWPIVLALGFPVIAFGIIVHPALAVVGLLVVVAGTYGWALEPSVEPDPGPRLGPPATSM